MNKNPFLVVSYAVPDRSSGTPVVIRKFLENFDKDECVLIGRPTLKKERIQGVKFKYPIMKIPIPPVGFRGEALWRLLSSLLGVIIGMIAIYYYKPKAILAFYRDESSLLTGYWLHKITSLPLYSYFCDIYLENYPGGRYRQLAAWLQPRIFHDSKKVIVLTEAMRDYYSLKYKIDTVVLPHCNNIRVLERSKEINNSEVCKIGYLGSVNIDRIQSLQKLCQAIKDNHSYHLSYFSSTSKEYIQQQNLSIENSSIEFIPNDEKLLQALSSCDILFLPLTISQERTERDAQVSTGFPTKVIEYLLCQKPILVHSKPDYFTAQFFVKNQCGLVIEGGKKELFNGLEKIRGDSKLGVTLSNNSFEIISSYFDGNLIANKFRKLLLEMKID